MRRILRVLSAFAAVIVVFFLAGFGTVPVAADAVVTVLNRSGQATTRITDGDTLRLQVTLSQKTTQPRTITFTLGEHGLAVGSCTVAASGNSCQTDPFPSLGWHWDAGAGSPAAADQSPGHTQPGVGDCGGRFWINPGAGNRSWFLLVNRPAGAPQTIK
jgi:hypothetical protein